jgi:predicted ester cyclase
MSTKQNKALLQQFIDGMNKHDSAIWDRFCAPEFVMHVNTMDSMTLEQSKQFGNGIDAAFPDGSATIEDMIAERDMIAVRYAWRATHKVGYARCGA